MYDRGLYTRLVLSLLNLKLWCSSGLGGFLVLMPLDFVGFYKVFGIFSWEATTYYITVHYGYVFADIMISWLHKFH